MAPRSSVSFEASGSRGSNSSSTGNRRTFSCASTSAVCTPAISPIPPAAASRVAPGTSRAPRWASCMALRRTSSRYGFTESRYVIEAVTSTRPEMPSITVTSRSASSTGTMSPNPTVLSAVPLR